METITFSLDAEKRKAIDKTELPFSHQDFWKAIRSLQRRCLLEKATDNTTGDFVLQPVIKEYVKNKP